MFGVLADALSLFGSLWARGRLDGLGAVSLFFGSLLLRGGRRHSDPFGWLSDLDFLRDVLCVSHACRVRTVRNEGGVGVF